MIVEGTLEVLAADRRGRTRRLGLIEAGSVMGELTFLDGEPRSALVRAITETTVLRLTLENFEVLAAKEPALGRYLLFELARLLARRLRSEIALTPHEATRRTT